MGEVSGDLGFDEQTLRSIKAAADQLRHGEALSITSDNDRAEQFIKTWEIVDGYLGFGQQ
jgi:hypothetical protein